MRGEIPHRHCIESVCVRILSSSPAFFNVDGSDSVSRVELPYRAALGERLLITQTKAARAWLLDFATLSLSYCQVSPCGSIDLLFSGSFGL